MDERYRHPEQSVQTVPTRRVLRLTDLLFVVRKRLLVIVICAAVGLIVGIALSVVPYMRGEMPKAYAITSSIAVTSQDKNGLFIAQSNNPNSTDIYLAENMVDAVIYVLKSDQTLNAAIDRLGLLGVSTRDISRNLNLDQYNEAQIIEMTLYWRSASEGVEILKAINAVAPDILVNTLKIGSVSVIRQLRQQLPDHGQGCHERGIHPACRGKGIPTGAPPPCPGKADPAGWVRKRGGVFWDPGAWPG